MEQFRGTFQADIPSVRFKLPAATHRQQRPPAKWPPAKWSPAAIQADVSSASNVQMQVSCVRGGGGRGRVVAVTSIGSTSHLKNVQMANVLDKGCESGKSCA